MYFTFTLIVIHTSNNYTIPHYFYFTLFSVFRNINLLRYINRELGTPINRFSIMARIAIEGYHDRSVSQPITYVSRLKTWSEIQAYDLLIWYVMMLIIITYHF